MSLKAKFLSAVLLLCLLQSVTSKFCYWNTGCTYQLFSGKTPYNLFRGDIRDSLIKLTDCEPISIWGIMRHGKNHPSVTDAKQMEETIFIKDYVISSYENGNSSLCAQDVENLRNWVPDKEIFDKANQLSEEGYQEMEGIGRRLKQAFPELLGKLNKDDYTFRAVVEKWAIDSMKGFIKGLGNKNFNIDPPKNGYDNIAPYETCNKYIKDVKLSNTVYEESKNYRNNSEFYASKDRVRRRLGVNYPLTHDHIIAMWDICRLTSSGIKTKFSPWCALFTSEDLMVVEYEEDLRHYYKSGYGTSMNKLFGEIVISELLKSFKDAKEGNGKKITSYITHSDMMNMIYTALELFKDASPLTGAQRKPDRKWRTSRFSMFSNNLIAVLNKCKQSEDNNFNVIFYLNEEPLKNICKKGVCSWKEFEEKLSPFLKISTDFCESTNPSAN